MRIKDIDQPGSGYTKQNGPYSTIFQKHQWTASPSGELTILFTITICRYEEKDRDKYELKLSFDTDTPSFEHAYIIITLDPDGSLYDIDNDCHIIFHAMKGCSPHV